MEAWRLNALDAHEEIAAGRLSAAELAEACIGRIEAVDEAVGAWQQVDLDTALAGARSAELGSLHGVPFGVKDVFNTRDYPTAMGSAQWAGFTPGNDARVVFNARRAGAFILGKTVTAELGVHEPGPTRNPHALDRSPGTSSSGSAAAVASGMVPWALGTQTAGSIVRPASYCGIYGFKPSYGAIPRTGILKTTDTLDSVGFLCRSPRDLRPLFEALRLSGVDYPIVHERLDNAPPSEWRRPRIAVLAEGLGDLWKLAKPDARAALAGFTGRLADAGAHVELTYMPAALREAHSLHATIYERSLAYYFANEAQKRDELSAVLGEMIDRGSATTLADYAAALDHQEQLRFVHDQWAARYDAVVTLSTAGTAPAWGEGDDDDSALIWTLCGAPSISAPALCGADGMPLGVQVVGRRWNDHALLDVVEWLAERGLLPEAPVADAGAASALAA
jgi:Asp-tRNA(Asn)/Glu-tRNA(Gln) amidotransferase A subunit family amidase